MLDEYCREALRIQVENSIKPGDVIAILDEAVAVRFKASKVDVTVMIPRSSVTDLTLPLGSKSVVTALAVPPVQL